MKQVLVRSHPRGTRLVRVAATITLLAFGSFLHAQDGKGKQHSVGEKTSEALGKLKPLQEAQNWDGMLKVLDEVQGVKPGSYDEALILDMKAKLYAQKNQLSKAIAPWERALQLSDQHGYFNERTTLDILTFLAQLYAQEGTTSKVPAQQQEHFAKSLSYFKRVLDRTPKPTPELMMTYASILFYKATANANQPDQALLKEARDVINKGLTTTIKPKDGFYQLLLALMQQQNDTLGSTELLELLLKQTPKKKDYWQMLMAMYLQLSDKAKTSGDPTAGRDYLVRAIVTFERAQALGFLTTPKDNMNLVSLYLMANQFTKGTEILYNGMKKGVIESDPNNWRVLGRYYQEANLNERAIEVLTEAGKLFPKNGDIELMISQIYLQMEKTKEAHNHAKAAIAKGNFESAKPYAVHYLVAYTAYELGDIDGAMQAIEQCEKYPEELKKDQQLPKLRDVVKEAIQDRESKKQTKDKADTKKTASAR